MRIYNWLRIATVCSLAAWAAGCSDSTTRAAAMSEDQIEKAVTEQIEKDPLLRAYDIDVDADKDKNEITLTGTVSTEAAREKAVAVAKQFGQNLSVTDKIEVEPNDVARSDYTEEMARRQRTTAAEAGESIGSTLDDAWIHTKIRTKLAAEGEFPFGDLNVDVVKNVVTLRGSVDSQEAKETAERIAKATDGVTQVKNRLVVKKG